MTKDAKLLDPDALERQLRKDLEVLRQYREVLARYGGEAPTGQPLSGQHVPSSPKIRGDDKSLVGVIDKNLTDEWRNAAYYVEKAREVRPKTATGPVRNTLKRLIEMGIADRRGDKASGVEYRRKP